MTTCLVFGDGRERHGLGFPWRWRRRRDSFIRAASKQDILQLRWQLALDIFWKRVRDGSQQLGLDSSTPLQEGRQSIL